MSIFGDFYSRAYGYRVSKKEARMRHSEDWSAAILAGSSENIQLEEPIRTPFFFVIVLLLVLSALGLLVRLGFLQIITGKQNSVLASGNRVRTNAIAAPRGAIYDKNGVILVRNSARFDLVVVPAQLPIKEDARAKSYAAVATILGLDVAAVKSKAEEKKLRYAQPIIIADNITREQALNLEEQHRAMIGFYTDVNPGREYLDGTTLAPFLGYIGRISAEEWEKRPEYRPIDTIGKTGLEKSYESVLRGEYGKEQIEVDATGLPVRYLARQEPVSGNSLVLSIDKGLQDVMAAQLKAGVERAGARAGAAVAVDPRNGQVLGAVNYPSYDGNLFARGISQQQYDVLLQDQSRPLFNRVSSGGYPVGSIIKPFISAAALQEGVVNGGTTIQDKGFIEVPNQYNPSIVYTFKGWKPEGLGTVNVARAIAMSSDIFYYMVGGGYQGFQGLGATKLTDWYKKFGLGKRVEGDVVDDTAGFVPTPELKKKYSTEPWYIGDTYNISIGQGDLRATPLQMVMATAAVANGGTLYKPHLASQIRKPDGTVITQIQPEIANKDFVKPDVIAQVRQGMEQVVESGTGCCSLKREVPVQVAGKTGTAETSSRGFDGKNPITKPHAWFSSYAPAKDPSFAMVVLIENAGEGSEFALPVSREILKWYFSQARE